MSAFVDEMKHINEQPVIKKIWKKNNACDRDLYLTHSIHLII